MVEEVRKQFNASFTLERYRALLDDLKEVLGEEVTFRVAETPFFVPDLLTQRMQQACDDICEVITSDDYYALSEAAIPPHQRVPGNDRRPDILIADFAVCVDEKGDPMPQLIEMQGFPSLFAYQLILDEAYRRHFDIPSDFTPYLNGYTRDSFYELMQEVFLNGHDPKQVILLEIEPEKQKTRADFQATEKLYGIRAVCISKLIREGKKLFYHRDGVKTEIKRIYNRVIFDELEQRPELIGDFSMLEEIEAEWVSHPNWFFRMSKFSLPYFKSPYIPETHFVHTLKELPSDLENWVLKPLYSFAGMGVNIHVQPADIAALERPEHFILQRKVKYEPVLQAPDAKIKVEVRMMLFWPQSAPKPVLVTNLCRLSRGELIGVRYNKDFEWVGSSGAYFRQSTR